jgi:hypothetical protein
MEERVGGTMQLQEGAALPEPTSAEKLDRGLKSGANWFYWIAGLSVVNSVVQLMGSDRSFIIGLGITQVVDAIATGATAGRAGADTVVVRGMALAIDLLVAGVFVLFGVQASRRRAWAFMVGMLLYALDGLVFLLVRDWMSVGFHGFALYSLWAGYSSLKALRASEVQMGTRPIGPGGA